MRIYEQPGISQFELAETGSFDKGTCARAVKKLEELGYLRRETRSSDRRSVQLYLTGQGELLVPVIQGMLLEWNAILCRTLQADEKEQAEDADTEADQKDAAEDTPKTTGRRKRTSK